MSLCYFLQGVTEVGRVFVLLSPRCHRSRACLCVPFSRVSQKQDVSLCYFVFLSPGCHRSSFLQGVSLCYFLQGVTEVGRVFVLLSPRCHRSRCVSLCYFLQGVTEVGRVFVFFLQGVTEVLSSGCHGSRACLCVTFSRVSQK